MPHTRTVPAYPLHLVERMTLADGTAATLRPVLPRDAVALQAFVAGLSDVSRNHRFDRGMPGLAGAIAQRMAEIDYFEQMALVLTITQRGREVVIADARYTVAYDGISAVFAVVVADEWQGQGLGGRLIEALAAAARAAQLWRIYGEVMPGNGRMLALMARCGFVSRLQRSSGQRVQVERRLDSVPPSRLADAAATPLVSHAARHEAF